VRVGIEVIVGAGLIIAVEKRVVVGLAHGLVVGRALGGLFWVLEANLGVVELVRAVEAGRALIGVVVAVLAATHLRAKIRAFAFCPLGVGFMAALPAQLSFLCVMRVKESEPLSAGLNSGSWFFFLF
jgi:hypothetical protein